MRVLGDERLVRAVTGAVTGLAIAVLVMAGGMAGLSDPAFAEGTRGLDLPPLPEETSAGAEPAPQDTPGEAMPFWSLGDGSQQAPDQTAPTPSDTASPTPATPEPSSVRPGWTVLVYLAADNNLETFGLSDINEMEAALPDEGVEVLVLIDRAQGFAEDAQNDWTGTRLYRIRQDNDPTVIRSEQLEDLGEINTGDPANLATLMAAGVRHAPAERYALILWNHGGGWSAMASDDDAGPGTGAGGQPAHDDLSLPELRAGVSKGLSLMGRDRLDLIGFDMCLMAQMEVAYEVHDLADHFVASQALEPGDGWAYDLVLPEFGRGTLGPRRLAARIVELFTESYEGRGERAITQSAFALADLPAVADAFTDMAAALEPTMASHAATLGRSMFWAEGFNPSGKRDDLRAGTDALSSLDLMDVARRLRAEMGESWPSAAEDAFQRLVTAYDSALLHNSTGPYHTASHGLSVYAPVRGDNLNPRYGETRFATETTWMRSLATLHDHLAASGENADVNIDTLRLIDGESRQPIESFSLYEDALVEVGVTGSDVLWVLASAARMEANGARLLEIGYLIDERDLVQRAEQTDQLSELLAPRFDRPGGASLEMNIDGTQTVVADSNGTLHEVTIDMTAFGQTAIGAIPVETVRARLSRDGVGEAEAVIQFDPLTGQDNGLVILTPTPDGGVSPRLIDPRPDDMLRLVTLLIRDDGTVENRLGPAFAYGRGLSLVGTVLQAGDYRLQAQVEGIAGTSRSATLTARMRPPERNTKLRIEAAQALSMSDLLGDWTLGEGNLFLRLRGIQDEPNLALAELPMTEMAGRGNILATLDNRGLPTLSIHYPASDDDPAITEHLPVFAEPGRNDILYLLVSANEDADDARYSTLVLNRASAAPSPGPTPGPTPGPSPGPAPAPAGLAGHWQGYSIPDGGTVSVIFKPDGTYEWQQLLPTGDILGVIGTYNLGNGMLVLNVSDYQPRQTCNVNGCFPLTLPQTMRLPVQASPDGMSLQAETFFIQRAR